MKTIILYEDDNLRSVLQYDFGKIVISQYKKTGLEEKLSSEYKFYCDVLDIIIRQERDMKDNGK